MSAVITEKSRHVSNQSQHAILPEVTCAIINILSAAPEDGQINSIFLCLNGRYICLE